MQTSIGRRMLPFLPLVAGGVLVVSGSVAIVRVLTAPTTFDVIGTADLIRVLRVDDAISMWTGFGIPVIGLVIVGFGVGLLVGRRVRRSE